jgi:hypothetical protein
MTEAVSTENVTKRQSEKLKRDQYIRLEQSPGEYAALTIARPLLVSATAPREYS